MTNIEKVLKSSKETVSPSLAHRNELKRTLLESLPTRSKLLHRHPEYAVWTMGISAAMVCWCVSIVLVQGNSTHINDQWDIPELKFAQVDVSGRTRTENITLLSKLSQFIPDAEMGRPITQQPQVPHLDF